MMNIKRLAKCIAVILAVLFALSAQAMSTSEKENAYNAAIKELEDYLASGEEDLSRLDGIENTLDPLNYEYSNQLRYYVLVLKMIALNDYGYRLNGYIEIISNNQRFANYLEEMNSSAIGSVELLENYKYGREYEYKGDKDTAFSYYQQCAGFFDADQRYESLMDENVEQYYSQAFEQFDSGDWAGAYHSFRKTRGYGDSEEFMALIESWLGYVPQNERDNPQPVRDLRVSDSTQSELVLTWTGVQHAGSYQVAYKKGNSSNWISYGDVSGTSVRISGLSSGTSYDIRVRALVGTVETDWKQLSGQTKSLVTPTPTVKPTQASFFSAHKGEIVSFGKQDGKSLQWRVLNVSNGYALMISENVIDWRFFNNSSSQSTWAQSTICSYLNSEFYNEAFSSSEKELMYAYSAAANCKVFLLSEQEARNYFNSASGRIAYPNNYCTQQGCYTWNNGACYWWLRDTVISGNGRKAKGITGAGEIDSAGRNENTDRRGVRPAIWVKVD